ncbi:hypothetical protein GCM10011332_13670 [Terasakiella brassicae]|uniref:Uncharacterized protein n=1 Tax=Terasakiella brassicae TaxID=1634917 RepID=A0A917BXY2_9PROT|nr:hypothetical protein [Terasakiella brassicae]GGF61114.1 hypothetical protein GCM10011332_13670 [Terasakiella brassicae]
MMDSLEKLIAAVVLSQNTLDSDLFISLFDPTLRDSVDPEKIRDFQQDLQQAFGQMQAPVPLASLSKNGAPWHLYTVRFSASQSDFLLSILLKDASPSPQALAIHIS